MALTTVLTERIRPERFRPYEELVQRLAKQAVQKREAWHWTTHQTAFGEGDQVHFVSDAENFATLGARGMPDALVRRLLGEKEGNEWLQRLNECVVSAQQTVSMERPDLSYPPERMERPYPAALVTIIRSRPGGREACEELIRKVAEAIPKAGDPARLLAYETLVGNPYEYWTVRPLRDLGDLDRQMQPADLLTKAFGAAEGGLIFRTGLEALEAVRREIVLYREDLSNPR
jgi:hypothetical protein